MAASDHHSNHLHGIHAGRNIVSLLGPNAAVKDPQDSAETGPDQRIRRYTVAGVLGRSRRYSGHVTYLDGAEGERLRGELASVTRELLTWAAVAQQTTVDDSADSYENGEAA